MNTNTYLPPLPVLETLDDHPSWLNNRGNVDRSACFVITGKELMALCRPLELQAAGNGRGRLVSGVGVVDAEMVAELHRSRRPRHLRGDYRWRTYAMEPSARGWDRGNMRGRRRLVDLCVPGHGTDHNLPGNPNAGMSQKVLGLAADWRQALRVETWEMVRIAAGDPRLPAHVAARGLAPKRHFLICPGRGGTQGRETLGFSRETVGVGGEKVGVGGDGRPRIAIRGLRGQVLYEEASAVAAAPLSVRPRGTNRPGGVRVRACVERAQMLHLPPCWAAEWRDAQLAQRWLREVDALRARRLLPPTRTAEELRVLERYGVLFEPRALLCKECLGVKYGKLLQKQIDPAIAHLFPRGRKPELPDPCALNKKGNQFMHDQLRQSLTKSQLKNKQTRAAALAELATLPAPMPRVIRRRGGDPGSGDGGRWWGDPGRSVIQPQALVGHPEAGDAAVGFAGFHDCAHVGQQDHVRLDFQGLLVGPVAVVENDGRLPGAAGVATGSGARVWDIVGLFSPSIIHGISFGRGFTTQFTRCSFFCSIYIFDPEAGPGLNLRTIAHVHPYRSPDVSRRPG